MSSLGPTLAVATSLRARIMPCSAFARFLWGGPFVCRQNASRVAIHGVALDTILSLKRNQHPVLAIRALRSERRFSAASYSLDFTKLMADPLLESR